MGEQVKELFVAGAMALTLMAQQTQPAVGPAASAGATSQSTQSQRQAQPQGTGTEAIPDAPRPQAAGINAVTPGKGTTVSSSGDAGQALSADPEQPPVPSSLADGPGEAAARREAQAADGPAPETPAAGQGAGAVETLRLRVNFVEIPFTVKDSKGRLVPGITWRDVRVYENGLRQQPRVFTVDPFPLSIALVIDQSLPFDTMTRVNNALGALPGAFTSYDEVAVFTYNNGPRMQTDFTSGQSARLAAVVERTKARGREPIYYAPGEGLGGGIDINNHAQDNITPLTSGHGVGSPQGVAQVPREAHPLNDAILEAAKATTRAGKGRRRIVYVISDGKEYGSAAKTKQVIQYLQTNKIAVYATLVGDSSVAGLGFLDSFHIPLTIRDNVLPVYTAATGGQTFAEYRTKGIEQSFSKIAEEVRTQYTIGYNSREPFVDGKFRSVDVRVLRPNLNVIAKKGYYPTALDSHPAAVRPISAAP